MSINSAMMAGASGLRANSSALAAISDNIANVNTVGFKRLRSDFTALLTAQSRQSTHSAGGVRASHAARMSEQGSLQGSSQATHLAISGDGFFAVRPRAEEATSLDPYLYTRAGAFSADSSGYLRNVGGYYLQGWPVSETGVVTVNPTDLSALQPIRVSGIAGGAQASSRLSVSANLDSSQDVSAAAATYNAATNNMASGAVTPDFQTTLQVYDSQGGLHTVNMSFLKQTANAWFVEVHLPAGEVLPGGGLVDGQVAAGIVQFTPFGQIDTAASTLPASFTINQNGVAGAPQWAATQGFAAQTVQLDIGGPNSPGGLTQFESPSILATSQVDGTGFGSLSAVEIDDEGFVTAIFTNGLSRQIYQIPIATFANVEGLIGEQNGVYRPGPGAGVLNMKGSGVAGAGQIQPRALESSTVDLAEEFSSLIITQRAYSASSKIIMTADEMMEELIRLKR